LLPVQAGSHLDANSFACSFVIIIARSPLV